MNTLRLGNYYFVEFIIRIEIDMTDSYLYIRILIFHNVSIT